MRYYKQILTAVRVEVKTIAPKVIIDALYFPEAKDGEIDCSRDHRGSPSFNHTPVKAVNICFITPLINCA